MTFTLFIAKRYLYAKQKKNHINISNYIAALGVVIGSFALFIVLSVFSGLRDFSSQFLQVSDPDLKISATLGKSFNLPKDFIKTIENTNEVEYYSKIVEERAFFRFQGKTHIAHIKGVDDNYTLVNKIDTTVFAGTWLKKKFENGVVVGNGIANELSIGIYDFENSLEIFIPKPGKGYITSPKQAFNLLQTQSIGIFQLTDDTDRKYVFSNLEKAQELMGYSANQLSAIEIKLIDQKNTPAVKSELQKKLGKDFVVKSREELNAVFYKMLNTENLLSYFIFTLILIIAMFNMVGAIIMMISDKKRNLKTFYKMGASIHQIKNVFLMQGVLLTFFSLIIGLSIAILLVLFQQEFQLFMITPYIAYPVKLTFFNFLTVFSTIIVLGFLASWIASSRVNRNLLTN